MFTRNMRSGPAGIDGDDFAVFLFDKTTKVWQRAAKNPPKTLVWRRYERTTRTRVAVEIRVETNPEMFHGLIATAGGVDAHRWALLLIVGVGMGRGCSCHVLVTGDNVTVLYSIVWMIGGLYVVIIVFGERTSAFGASFLNER